MRKNNSVQRPTIEDGEDIIQLGKSFRMALLNGVGSNEVTV
jgi:hypothetical protein